MRRTIKLYTNLLITAAIFNYFVLILIMLLNPEVSVTGWDFWLLFLNLFAYYGPIWFCFVGVIFFFIQFFTERKYHIGIFSPPTVTFFVSFNMLVITFFMYINYDYYIAFFSAGTRIDFIKILLIDLVMIILGIIFIFFRRINKQWLQLVILVLLCYNLVHTYSTVTGSGRGHILATAQRQKPAIEVTPPTPGENITRRKIRIVIMDGLSLNLIYSLAAEQKLLNFNEIIKKGAAGKIISFQPNLSLSLVNSALTGMPPSEFYLHSNTKFKFLGTNHEFNIRPRFIFFRKSSLVGLTTFFNKNENVFLDHIDQHYKSLDLETVRLLRPDVHPVYSKKSLHRNNRFLPLFSEILDSNDEKHELLKKAFYFDDYLMNAIRHHWKDDDIYYSIVRFPGLGVIGKYFYQYQDPDIGGNILEGDIKKYGDVIEKYYEYYASIIGNLISATGDDELLVILSFYEYEPLPIWRRILVNLIDQKDIYVYKSLQSQGTILLYEKNALKKDYPLKAISILDIYPTLLYYAGFPLSKDLQGEVIREIFTDEFVLNNPIDINPASSTRF